MKKRNDPFSPTPEGFHLRVEQTLNRLEEEKMTRRVVRPVAALIAAILILTATACAGYTYIDKSVDWNGHVSQEEVFIEEAPASTQSPAENALEDIPEGEVWSVLRPDGGFGTSPRLYTVDDPEQLRLMLYGTEMPMPNLENCTFEKAAIRMPAEDIPYEETVLAGEILQKRRMQPLYAGGALEYRVDLRTKDGGKVRVHCEKMDPARKTTGFGLHDGDTHERIKVDGWDRGICIAGEDGGLWVMLQFDSSDFLIELTARCDSPGVSRDELLSILPAYE